MAEESRKLAVRQLPGEIDLSGERQKLMRQTVANDLTQPEFNLFVEYVRATKLDPFRRQVYALKLEGKMSVHVGIDGLRLIAQRTGAYGGTVGPEWCGPDGKWRDIWLEEGPPAAARIGVIHNGMERPVWGQAKYTSYVQLTKDGKPRRMWATMPDHMLAKCAEALAIRRAFPAETSGLYVSMDDDGEVSDKPDVVNPDAPATNYQKGEIHRLAVELGMSEATYREWLEEATGKRSAAELTKGEASAIIDELGRLLADTEEVEEGVLVGDGSGVAQPPYDPEHPEQESASPSPGAGAETSEAEGDPGPSDERVEGSSRANADETVQAAETSDGKGEGAGTAGPGTEIPPGTDVGKPAPSFDPDGSPTASQWKNAEVRFKTKSRSKIAWAVADTLGITLRTWEDITAGQLAEAITKGPKVTE